jgi:predicted acylesterase/phospholipase RssA
MPGERLIKLSLIGVAAVLLSGCLAIRPNVPESGAGPAFGNVALFGTAGRPVENHQPEAALLSRSVLAISGGGSHGAFGAGVLSGWTASGKRPRFDVVTGISTGALIASFAFLGPAYDNELLDLYTQTRNEDVFLAKGLIGLFGLSVLDADPLHKKIDETITPQFLDAVAREHARGRRLYVGTTDLDRGVLVVWDMGLVAASTQPNKRELYRDILIASAAIPGAFEPVFLPAGQDASTPPAMHVDGGVKAPLLLRSFMLQGRGTKSVYLLVNGQMTLLDGSAPVRPNLIGITQKSINELLRGLLYKTAYQAYVTSRNSGASFNIAAIPDEATPSFLPIDFEAVGMRKLYDVGYQVGLRHAWSSEPPRLEALERIGGRRKAAR